MEKKPTLLFIGPVESRSGYGSHARDILRSLIKLNKFDISVWRIRWGITPLNVLKKGKDDDILNLIIDNGKLSSKPNICIQLTVPNEFQKIGEYNIGITAGIETNACSPEWIDGINRMELVIVPSNFAKSVFVNTIYTKTNDQQLNMGKLTVTTPIEVLFEGIDTNIYKQTNILDTSIRYKLKQIDESFVFLFVGHWLQGDMGHDRKDVGGLIKVFLETFKNKQNQPALLLKTGSVFSPIEKQDILKKINLIKSSIKGKLPNVYIIYGDLTDSEMNSLYNHPKIKANITFTKGEGFGRPLLECSVTGKPIICGGFGGQTDFLNNSNSVILPGALKEVHASSVWEKVIIPQSKWFYVDYAGASNLIYDVWKRIDFYKNKSSELITKNSKEFSFDKMTEQFDIILNKYVPKFATHVDINLPPLPNLPKLKRVNEVKNNEI